MLKVNIADEKESPKPKTLREIINGRYTGVYIPEGRPEQRVYVNGSGDYFIFDKRNYLVQGEDDTWFSQELVPVDEKIEVNFKSK